MDYNLTEEQEIKYNEIVERSKDKINLALYKCNIPYKQYDEFYSFALEGLLVSFILVENNVIPKTDFEKFSYTSMKRKIIDELRRRNKEKYVCVDKLETIQLFEYQDSNISKLEIVESMKKELTTEEYKIFKMLVTGKDKKEIFRDLSISKSKGYTIIAEIKDKCGRIVYNL